MSSLKDTKQVAKKLVTWYRNHQRDLPWRQQTKAYPIWISEVMLQQTTSQAVIPYYKKFLKRFPTLKSLAVAPQEDVLEHWAGLGYYSRARNLHKAAQIMNEQGFPQSYKDLLPLPGFGPYTSRSVASLAFGEAVGVLDGNVIRVLCRLLNLKVQWWKTKERQQLQDVADVLASQGPSSPINQGLMELGATICTPTNPSCLICPLRPHCIACHKQTQDLLPLAKPKKTREILLWKPLVVLKKKQLAVTENNYAPFLKKAKLPPGEIRRLKKKPKSFAYKHTITHYDIYTQLPAKPLSAKDLKGLTQTVEWISLDKVHKQIPYNLVTKALKHLELL